MKLTMLAPGTLGDVVPVVSLGSALQRQGHYVRIGAFPDFEDFIGDAGLEFAPVGPPVLPRVQSDPALANWQQSGRNLWKFTNGAYHMMLPIDRLFRESFDASTDADALVCFTSGLLAGDGVAEKLDIPLAVAHVTINNPTRAYPSYLIDPPFHIGSFGNLATYGVAIALQGVRFFPAINKTRKQVLGLGAPKGGLKQVTGKGRLATVFGFSEAVVPKPADWDDEFHICGYWFQDAHDDWQPADDLVEFLGSGTKPVCLGFGSAVGTGADKRTRIVLNALKKSEQRAVLLTGSGGLDTDDLPDSVYALDHVPHDWLLPQVAAFVHHGGAGTTAAALRAGTPALISPHFGDQYFWGYRIHELGAGVAPIPDVHLTADRLATALRKLTSDPSYSQRAGEIGKVIAAEDGAGRAATVISDALAKI